VNHNSFYVHKYVLRADSSASSVDELMGLAVKTAEENFEYFDGENACSWYQLGKYLFFEMVTLQIAEFLPVFWEPM